MNAVRGDAEGMQEQPYVRELMKQARNINKKLLGMQKTDAVLAENPAVSLDDLVATKKINADQKAAVLKKPLLKEQLDTLEGQIRHYREFEKESQARLVSQREELLAQNEQALARAWDEATAAAIATSAQELRKKLLIFSQFLRCAAHKRTVEDDAEEDENRAFEGALLLVYGGDQKAVDAAIKIIDGADASVPAIEGFDLPIRYSQVKQASIDHAPYQEPDDLDETHTATATAVQSTIEPSGSDPTLTHAGLTELEPKENGTAAPEAGLGDNVKDVADASGNVAGERWDTTAAGAESSALEDSFEMVPRPQDEVDVHTSQAATSAAPTGSTSWADEAPAYEKGGATGNQAGERWDTKAAGDVQADETWPSGAVSEVNTVGGNMGTTEAGADGDGFQSVAGRQRAGRGGRGQGGELRGRGGRGRGGVLRGDGDFRGRGRGGGFRGGRGGAADAEGRGRGRGRGGVRGAALAAATIATDGQPPR